MGIKGSGPLPLCTMVMYFILASVFVNGVFSAVVYRDISLNADLTVGCEKIEDLTYLMSLPS